MNHYDVESPDRHRHSATRPGLPSVNFFTSTCEKVFRGCPSTPRAPIGFWGVPQFFPVFVLLDPRDV